ncbi:MAG: DUF499 domain-containing protein [Actinomycetota bacterium]|nr:DUF499 domain-containing protein [Actinomycetota bacterium]
MTSSELSPWYKVATPRGDLRDGKALDAAQFAIHLDRIAADDAPPEYLDPESFFSRTYLTEGLRRFAGEALRRLAGERQGSNAVLNLVTGFGGGKTHALTALYHLSKLGPSADTLPGVTELLNGAGLSSTPGPAAVAVFVGTDWDVTTGAGAEGEPRRLTPWGEIGWQLSQQSGDPSLFEAVAEQDAALSRPGKSVIRKMLPKDRPVLILMDEVMNFMTGARSRPIGGSTLASQFYEFLHNLTEEADSRDGLCVVVSLPKSEGEMSAEDEADFTRLENVTKRVALPYVLAKDLDVPEIVRRRLFETVGDEAKVRAAAVAFSGWMKDHRDQLPGWFSVDNAEDTIAATYPFHPTVLSVFERKWQTLPSFQRTRGVLRLLAQWVSIAYESGFRGAHEDALIGIGTAPLEDQFFRAALLDQLGSEGLQGAILADISGGQAHAVRLDAEAEETLKKARIYTKTATTILFESSGGMAREYATLPEVRLAVGEPDLDIGNVETSIDALLGACYYLTATGTGYRFSTKANLNRKIADRRAALGPQDVEGEAKAAIASVFGEKKGVTHPFDLVVFPEEDRAVPDSPALRLVVLPPEDQWGDATRETVEEWMASNGASPRQFKNGLVWAVADQVESMYMAARNAVAWRSLEEESGGDDFDDEQRRELAERTRHAGLDLKEAVWKAYRTLVFLGQSGNLEVKDLGLLHSSAAESMQALIQGRLRQDDELTDGLSPNQVVRNWPKSGADLASPEWSTRQLRDAVFASPRFTRLSDSSALRDTISRGVADGLFGYAERGAEDSTILFSDPMSAEDVEFSEEVVLIPANRASALKESEPGVVRLEESAPGAELLPRSSGGDSEQIPIFSGKKFAGIRWQGEVPQQKWTTFYMKVLSRLAQQGGLTLKASFESRPTDGLLEERVSEVREALAELGLDAELSVEESEVVEDS